MIRAQPAFGACRGALTPLDSPRPSPDDGRGLPATGCGSFPSPREALTRRPESRHPLPQTARERGLLPRATLPSAHAAAPSPRSIPRDPLPMTGEGFAASWLPHGTVRRRAVLPSPLLPPGGEGPGVGALSPRERAALARCRAALPRPGWRGAERITRGGANQPDEVGSSSSSRSSSSSARRLRTKLCSSAPRAVCAAAPSFRSSSMRVRAPSSV
jgi:hypothetical protein